MKTLIHNFFSKVIVPNYFELRTIFIVSFFTFIVYFVGNSGWEHFPDSYDYIQGIDAVLLNEDWYDYKIAFYPGAVYFSIPFTLFFDNTNSFGFHNLVLYIMSGPMFYLFVNKLTENQKFSMYSSLFFVTSFPVIYWGLGILSDLGSWFFIILSYYLIISIVNNNFERRRLILGAFVTGIGVLYKTTVGCTAIFFTLLVIINPNKSERSKLIISWLLFATISFLPLLINQFYIMENWNLSYELFINEKLSPNSDHTGVHDLKLTNIYKIYTFIIAFPIFPISLLGLLKLKQRISKINYLYVQLIFLSCFIMVFILSRDVASPRWTFIMFPSLYILLALGLRLIYEEIKNRFTFNADYFLIFIIFLNFILSLTFSLYDGEVRDTLGFWPKTF